MSDEQIINALKLIATKYGKPMASTIEQLFRNETRHFKSVNFAITLSPGMEATKDVIPYGWGSLKEFWTLYINYAPIGIHKQVENSSAMAEARKEPRKFIVFQNLESSMMSVAFIINKRGGDGGSWFSVDDATLRKKYNDILKTIIPRFVNANIK